MSMEEILSISNSTMLWIICGALVAWVCVQALLFVRLSFKEATVIQYPAQNLKRAIGNGMVTAVGPALAGVVVMISMMAVIGGPITWQRLSIIGAAQTELTAANVGAQALGTELGGADFTLTTLALCFLVMAVNGCGWLLMTTIFTSSMENVRVKLSGGDAAWLGLLSAGATIGLFANFSAQRLLAGMGQLVAVIVGFGAQWVLDNFVAPKFPKIRGYNLAIALVLAVVVAYLVQPV